MRIDATSLRGATKASGVAGAPLEVKPLGSGMLAGLVASLCCGGSLVFASIGLGAAYGALGLARYIPQALALGTLSIVAINWLYYRRRVARVVADNLAADCAHVRRAMLLSAGLGLLIMAGSFTLLEWLNHAVVNAARMMTRQESAQALIPGVPNDHLLYVALTFLALPLLAVLPLSRGPRAAY